MESARREKLFRSRIASSVERRLHGTMGDAAQQRRLPKRVMKGRHKGLRDLGLRVLSRPCTSFRIRLIHPGMSPGKQTKPMHKIQTGFQKKGSMHRPDGIVRWRESRHATRNRLSEGNVHGSRRRGEYI